MTMELFDYHRRKTGVVHIGGTPLGGDFPIRVQSMTNTSTMDTDACVAQTLRIAEAGGDYVRLTTQGVREAENMRLINTGVREAGCNVPLVADVHFNPKVADAAALYAEKVRVNPGNYVDAARTFKHIAYTDEEYAQELKKIEERFVPFLRICRENHTAVRIGVNHGSLSDRIMSRYGDTPGGNSGELYGVSTHLREGKLYRCGDFHQGKQYGGHGAERAPAGAGDGTGRHGLPPAFGCDRSR